MIQFYFMVVALNLACGLALVLPERPHPRQLQRHLDIVLSDIGVRIALGVLGIASGILAVISPVQGDVPLIGDIVPAFTATLAGLVLLFEGEANRRDPVLPDPHSPDEEAPRDEEKKDPKSGSRARFRAFLVGSGKVIGLAAIIAGLIHFLFPLELFL